jgi:sulfide dehydrogenase [flavocytochrome c] flavoprotein chain
MMIENKKVGLGRRRVLGALGGGTALGVLGLAGCAAPAIMSEQKRLGKVMIIGAGFGGATAAKYLKKWGGSQIEVMLVERETQFISCPMSNLVIGGSYKMQDITMGYAGLRDAGVIVLNDEVTAINPTTRKVELKKIADQSYDKIIVSPGVDFQFDQIQGFNADAQKMVLHAWKAGQQTADLRKQLEDMPDGGVFVISVPRAPYRCPPGPYERASQVAHYFKTNKPRSKVIVLDANEDIVSKKALFLKAWENYKGILEYRNNANVTELDAKGSMVITELGDKVKGDVLNLIPPMSAGALARSTGLINANNRWCGVDWLSMESTVHKNIHVLGDATLSAALMPKSGHMANQHGKTAAAAIVEMMNQRAPQPMVMANTCYSFVDDKNVVHVASVHTYNAEKKTMEVVAGSGGLSAAQNELEGAYAKTWAKNIWADMLT